MVVESRNRFEVMDTIALKAAVTRAIEDELKTAPDLTEFEARGMARLYCAQRLEAVEILCGFPFRSDLGLHLLEGERDSLKSAITSADTEDYAPMSDYLYNRGKYLNEEDIDQNAGLGLMYLARTLGANCEKS